MPLWIFGKNDKEATRRKTKEFIYESVSGSIVSWKNARRKWKKWKIVHFVACQFVSVYSRALVNCKSNMMSIDIIQHRTKRKEILIFQLASKEKQENNHGWDKQSEKERARSRGERNRQQNSNGWRRNKIQLIERVSEWVSERDWKSCKHIRTSN